MVKSGKYNRVTRLQRYAPRPPRSAWLAGWLALRAGIEVIRDGLNFQIIDLPKRSNSPTLNP